MVEQEKDEGGRGDRLALMRLYDELDGAGKQELLRFAMSLRRQSPAEPAALKAAFPGPADIARAAVMLSGSDVPTRLAALAAKWTNAGDAERAAHYAAAAEEAKAILAEATKSG